MARRLDISELKPDSFGPEGEFHKHTRYNRHGDVLEIWLSNTPSDGKRLDKVITIYLDMDSDRITGFEIKGIRNLLKKYAGFRRMVSEKEHILLEIILYVLHYESCQRKLTMEELEILKDTYDQLFSQVGNVEIEISEDVRKLAMAR